jgi:hypothetical protein
LEGQRGQHPEYVFTYCGEHASQATTRQPN